MSQNDWWNKYMSLVCGRNRSRRRMTEYQEASCSRGWIQQLEMNACSRPSFLSPSVPSPPVLSPSPSLSSPFYLALDPVISGQGVWRSTVNSLSGLWGETPADIKSIFA